MKIIIDIDEKDYNNIEPFLNGKTIKGGINLFKTLEIIKNGTPLPKGHGRIADMDEAIKCIEDVEGEDAIWAVNLIEWACSKRTIIEADKED